jgi:NAD(P)-dependent dehydrogenase (short-subunit alcohol dehydrogenase family)
MKLLEGKGAIVTGGSSGIGRSVSMMFASEGARVVVADLNEEGGQETVSLIRSQGATAVFVRADSSSPGDNKDLIDAAMKEFGALHVACNNAGIAGPLAPTGEYPPEAWDRVIATNLSGVFFAMRYEIPAMEKSGGGAIVNMGSILSQVGFRTAPAYVAAKHGLVGLTQTAALEYAAAGIRINAVGPAFIRTPMIAAIDEKAVIPLHPAGRLGLPEEVAELVLFLCSAKAAFMTGTYIPIDGGYLAQ